MAYKKYSAFERREHYAQKLKSKNKNQRDFAVGYLEECSNLEADPKGSWSYWQGRKSAERMQAKLYDLKF